MNLRQVTPITTNMQKDPILPTKIKTYRAKEDGKKKKTRAMIWDFLNWWIIGGIYIKASTTTLWPN
jgi:hypothetical protein